jgi:hypothetical protein
MMAVITKNKNFLKWPNEDRIFADIKPDLHYAKLYNIYILLT